MENVRQMAGPFGPPRVATWLTVSFGSDQLAGFQMPCPWHFKVLDFTLGTQSHLNPFDLKNGNFSVHFKRLNPCFKRPTPLKRTDYFSSFKLRTGLCNHSLEEYGFKKNVFTVSLALLINSRFHSLGPC